MDLLVFKLVVTPLLLVAASLAVRRWGEAIGGLLVALPLTSGPISVFLAMEHGATFAAQATAGSLIATAAQALFCFAYFKLAPLGWGIALASACATFAAVAALLQHVPLSEISLFLVAVSTVMLTLNLLPSQAIKAGRLVPPWWDLPMRMLLIAGLVVGVTLIAPYVGAKTSGVLASFPFMTIILAVFTHRQIGHAAAQQLARGVVAGLLSFCAFSYLLSLTLPRLSLFDAYGISLLCTLAIQAVFLYRMRVPVAMATE